jgi:twitching motility protein PilT
MHKGLVLVTGPTGSGKSTTLATLVEVINKTHNKHIITLEDPIEYLHRHDRSIVNQREIGIDSHSYASALRAALREDPDVILVGEMRDLDTISTAITAAETGHLVFSTLHTTGAANTIDRIIDVFPPHQQQQIRIQLAGVLEAVVSQQLLPRISGGRIAAMEVMRTNPAIRNLIRESKTHQLDTIIQTSRKSGMITMDEAIHGLYENGEITKDTALEYAQDPQNMKRKL